MNDTDGVLPGAACPTCGFPAIMTCQCSIDGKLYHMCRLFHDWCYEGGMTRPTVAPCHLPSGPLLKGFGDVLGPSGDPRWN